MYCFSFIVLVVNSITSITAYIFMKLKQVTFYFASLYKLSREILKPDFLVRLVLIYAINYHNT